IRVPLTEALGVPAHTLKQQFAGRTLIGVGDPQAPLLGTVCARRGSLVRFVGQVRWRVGHAALARPVHYMRVGLAVLLRLQITSVFRAGAVRPLAIAGEKAKTAAPLAAWVALIAPTNGARMVAGKPSLSRGENHRMLLIKETKRRHRATERPAALG